MSVYWRPELKFVTCADNTQLTCSARQSLRRTSSESLNGSSRTTCPFTKINLWCWTTVWSVNYTKSLRNLPFAAETRQQSTTEWCKIEPSPSILTLFMDFQCEHDISKITSPPRCFLGATNIQGNLGIIFIVSILMFTLCSNIINYSQSPPCRMIRRRHDISA